MDNLESLVLELCKLPEEIPYVEFKHNNYDPKMIGEDISALANSATLYEKSCAYMLWGIHNETHEILGTDRDLQNVKKGNQELENWLRVMLSSNADFEFNTVYMNNKRVCVLIIYRAVAQTVTFEKTDYIRVGSYTKKLSDHPTLQAKLWERLRTSTFEERLAMQDLDAKTALSLLDYSLYFDLSGAPNPLNPDAILHYLLEETLVVRQDNGLYAITNLGAILFAKKLSSFSKLSRKAVRVVQYKGNNRVDILKEEIENSGYVIAFEGLIRYIEALLPSQEVIEGALRTTHTVYPNIAVREAIANALIHQDFSITGTGPVIEIFDKRIEITNPGIPLIDIYRIVDNPPKSRNEKLASLMRRLKMCEELGTGWDKIVISCELYQLPAPVIDLYAENTKVTLFSELAFSSMSQESKLWSCYMHACIKYLQREQLTNSSLRQRFGLPPSSAGSISRLIKDAAAKKYIRPLDPDTAPRYMSYIPCWAQ